MTYKFNGKECEARRFYHVWKETGLHMVPENVFEKITFGYVLNIAGVAETIKEMSVSWTRSFMWKGQAGIPTLEVSPGHLDLIPYVNGFLEEYHLEDKKGRVYPDEFVELLKSHGFKEELRYNA